ncbi:hypothetical protein [Spiroplasma endosymbiont of Nebria brevicollis]|uniref:hypothetical protein n=1 Tax=Spiroplasma endosymbiont of Nebria brevicollis TaxID=3066284 RepID=UPI00313B3C53
MLYFNGFMSAFFTNNLENIIGNGGLIPLNAFAIGKLLGANVSTTAMTMKLTDRISVYPWDPKTGHKLKTKEQISTVDLSQKKNNKVYILAEDTEFLDIASPLTNLDTEMQWNPTSNGVSDGSNYAYIIDTIVTQSLHQGEERHTFYSDNPFTYQGDYNELSIAKFRYKNKGALTSNAFNWTTLYKLNHDEYKETEETTFSYPANILPPSPQNIAKPIIINPTLNIEMTANNIALTDTTDVREYKSNDYNWWINNKNIINNKTIDLKSLLDPTLLINTFNDLQRYYKSITIYYSYNIETKEEIHNLHDFLPINFSTTESFNPAKIEDTSITIDLKDLILRKKEPFNETWKADWNNGKLGNTFGFSFVYGATDMDYNFSTYEFKLLETRYSINNKLTNNSNIGISIKDNNSLNWTFYLQGTLGKIEGVIQGEYVNTYSYGMRYITNINASIYKIVLNAR